MFIQKVKEKYKIGEPIFIEDIINLFPDFSRAYVFQLIKKAEEKGEILKFSRGVYCLPKKSVFGNISLTSSVVANNKYITDGDSIYGIYAGLTLLNNFAVSSQVPNTVEIVTNNEATRKRIITIEGMKFIIRKSRFKITKDNYNYYSLLQLFLELGVNPKIDDFSKQRIKNFIIEKGIDQKKLMKLAMYFPAQTLKNMIGSEVTDGII